MWSFDETRVFAVSGLDLRVVEGGWPFAERNKAEIDARWQARTRENPAFFNGVIHLLTEFSLDGGVLSGRFIRAEFKSFLYWRETGHADQTVMDAFGSGLILSSDDRMLLGRQRAGNLNSGLCYPPGGFIDGRDVRPDGRIDIEGSVAREIFEETGLATPAFERAGDYVVTIAGPSLSIAVPYRASLGGAALIDAVRAHIASDPGGELADVLLVDPGEQPVAAPMPAYAQALLSRFAELKILA